jgi:hypothetical protein
MERRLLVMTHIGGALAIGFGIAPLASEPFYLHAGWLHVKLAVVLVLVLVLARAVKRHVVSPPWAVSPRSSSPGLARARAPPPARPPRAPVPS